MSETVVYECGHCDGKGVCEKGVGNWSCKICLEEAGDWNTTSLRKIVKCGICEGSSKIVKIINN